MGRRAAVAGAAAIMTLGLAACSASPAPTDATTRSPTATTPTATAPATTSPSAPPTTATTPTSPASGPLVMPTCDQIMDAAATAELFDSAIVPITGLDGLDPQALPGPAAQAALASASHRVSCMWGIPNSDGGFHGVVAELDPATREQLVAALEASDYERSTVAGAPTWGTDIDDVMGYSVSYTIDGDAWVIVLGTLFFHGDSAPVTERALAALRAVNA